MAVRRPHRPGPGGTGAEGRPPGSPLGPWAEGGTARHRPALLGYPRGRPHTGRRKSAQDPANDDGTSRCHGLGARAPLSGTRQAPTGPRNDRRVNSRREHVARAHKGGSCGPARSAVRSPNAASPRESGSGQAGRRRSRCRSRHLGVREQPSGLLSGWYSPPPPFADGRATYLGLAALVTFFQRVFQTRFLLFRFRDLRLTFLRGTGSM